MTMYGKDLDVILFGATGFVGRIVARYMLAQYGVGRAVRWAIAGRSQDKLLALRDALGPEAAALEGIVADASCDEELSRICSRTRAVMSTVGPYALYGEPLVRACADGGTDYVDLTGEIQWVRRMMTRYLPHAERSGARIIHSCGFDSIPSDLGVRYLQQQSRRQFGVSCRKVAMRVRGVRGGTSGGTTASLVNVVREAYADRSVRRELADIYSLCPPGTPRSADQRSVTRARMDGQAGAWIAPFVMAPINERVVLRSNALNRYAEDFSYNEALMTGTGLRGALIAAVMTVGTWAFWALAYLPPSRRVLERFVLPQPGQGPSTRAQEEGYFDLRFFGETARGETLCVRVTGDRDPGYGSTAKMLAEAGLSLALDIDRDKLPGGFWTPASAFGESMIARLEQRAGLRFERLDP